LGFDPELLKKKKKKQNTPFKKLCLKCVAIIHYKVKSSQSHANQKQSEIFLLREENIRLELYLHLSNALEIG